MGPVPFLLLLALVVSHCVLWRVVWASTESREFCVAKVSNWRERAAQELAGYLTYFASKLSRKNK
jgi:hypothetical protein